MLFEFTDRIDVLQCNGKKRQWILLNLGFLPFAAHYLTPFPAAR
jgi:hypothetical protein